MPYDVIISEKEYREFQEYQEYIRDPKDKICVKWYANNMQFFAIEAIPEVVKQLHAKIDRMKNRNLWDRIWNKDL